jgi:acyl-CoA thioesterase
VTAVVGGPAAFLGLVWGEDPATWTQPLTAGLTGGRGDLFGGCAVGAAVAGLERHLERPVVWLTCQFLTASRPPEVLDYRIDRLVHGRNMSQVALTAWAGERAALGFQAALGSRPEQVAAGRWLDAPVAPAPDRCPPAESFGSAGLRSRFDIRMAPSEVPPAVSGSSLWWVRAPDGAGFADLGSPALGAVVADFVPLALSVTLATPVFGSSLDNTVRVVGRTPTEWCLAQTQLDAVGDGIAQVTCRLWTAAGEPLLLGTQTCVVSDRPAAVVAEAGDAGGVGTGGARP